LADLRCRGEPDDESCGGEYLEFPALAAQTHVWYLGAQLRPDSVNIMRITVWPEHLEPETVRVAAGELISRYESLRTVFCVKNRRLVQRILSHFNCQVEVVAAPVGVDDEDRWRSLHEQLETIRTKPFDLTASPAVRFCLASTPAKSVVALIIHHILVDGWAIKILTEELQNLLAGLPSAGAEPGSNCCDPQQPSDLAAWETSEDGRQCLERNLAYWKERLRHAPLSSFPAHRRPISFPVSPHTSVAGSTVSPGHVQLNAESLVADFRLSSELLVRLRALESTGRSTLYMIFLAASHVLLFGATQQRDIVFLSNVLNRNRPGTLYSIAQFAQPLYLRQTLKGDPTFVDWLKIVRDGVLEGFARSQYSAVALHDWICKEAWRRGVWFQPMLYFDYNFPHPAPVHAGDDTEDVAPDTSQSFEAKNIGPGRAGHAMILRLDTNASGLDAPSGGASGSFSCNTQIFSPKQLRRLVDDFLEILDCVGKDPKIRVSRLRVTPLLGPGYKARKPKLLWTEGLLVDVGAVEAVLEEAPSVREWSLQIVRGGRAIGPSADRTFLAHIVSARSTHVAEVRRELLAGLRHYPGAIVPQSIHVVDRLPGDEGCHCAGQRLMGARFWPAGRYVSEAQWVEYIPPATATEELLASAIADVVDVEPVGMAHSYLGLGAAASLDALPLLFDRLRSQGMVVLPTLSLFFTLPAPLREVAAWLDELMIERSTRPSPHRTGR
jgi:hypothetical protein